MVGGGGGGGRNNCLLGLPPPTSPQPTAWGHGLAWPPSSSLLQPPVCWSYENNLCVAGSFSAIPARLRCFVFLHLTFQSQSQGAFCTSVLLEGNWMMALKPYFGKNRFPEPLQAAEPAELCHCSADRTQCGSSPHVGSGISCIPDDGRRQTWSGAGPRRRDWRDLPWAFQWD